MKNITEACQPAAAELKSILLSNYLDADGRVHPETVIGAAAALTGEFVARATGLPLPESGFIFGDAVNGILFESTTQSTAWGIFKQSAKAAGLHEEELPNTLDIIKRVADAAARIVSGEQDIIFPPISVPSANIPLEWSPNAGPRLRGTVQAVGAKHQLDPPQLAFALAIATAELVAEARAAVPPEITAKLAAEILFATAKMAPIEAVY